MSNLRDCVVYEWNGLDLVTSDKGGGKCFCQCLCNRELHARNDDQCLSVSPSVSKITQKRVHGFGWNVTSWVSTDVGTWTNWLTFEPDPDYRPSLDAGTRLLSLISYALQCGILYRENPTYRYWTPIAAATHGFKMVLFTVTQVVGTTFVVGATWGIPRQIKTVTWHHHLGFCWKLVHMFILMNNCETQTLRFLGQLVYALHRVPF